MVIVGVDPGYAIMGYGAVRHEGGRFKVLEQGCVETPARAPMESRLLKIHAGLTEVLERVRPDALAVEKLFFNTNTTTAMGVAQARGVILVAAAALGVPVAEYTPLQVKTAVTGYGRGDKSQVQQMVRILLGLPAPPKPDDVADALAVAICHAHSGKLLSYRARA